MRHISFPSIEQFRNVISTVNHMATFTGLDEQGEPMYNPIAPKPTLTFKGTVKLHGTNASVCYNAIDGLWVQSRENIIFNEKNKDNNGFARFVEENRNAFTDLIAEVLMANNIDSDRSTVCIYGEWAGGAIQKGVALNNIDKAFFIFGVKIADANDPLPDTEIVDKSYWVDYTQLRNHAVRIFNVDDFPTYTVEIDFNNPKMIQNKLIELTIAIEDECPVGKFFGHSGVGEGIVFTSEYKGKNLRFKSKGEKHSVTKVKVLNEVDIEKLNSINEFVEYAVTENRFNQAIEKVFGDKPADVKQIADLMRWMVNDIVKEESDTMQANGLEAKEVGKSISNKVRTMFFHYLDKQLIV